MSAETISQAILGVLVLLGGERGLSWYRTLRTKPNGSAGSQSIDFWKMALREAYRDAATEQVNILKEIRDDQKGVAESLTKLVTIAEIDKRH